MLIKLYVLTIDGGRHDGSNPIGEPHQTRAAAVESLRGYVADRLRQTDEEPRDDATPYDAMDEDDLIAELSDNSSAQAGIEEWIIELRAADLELAPEFSPLVKATAIRNFCDVLEARRVDLVLGYDSEKGKP